MRLLDTNICSAFLDGTDAGVVRQMRSLEEGEAYLCSVVKADLLYGAHASGRVERNLAKLESFFELFPSLAFDDDAAEEYGRLRSHLKRAGTPVGANDLLIAATALSQAAVLVTRNESEFRRIPGLRVEVW